MKILGIETSCDETGVAIIEATSKDKPVKLLSNIIASSLSKHSVTGGIIPEVAAREQIKFILPVLTQALKEGSSLNKNNDIPDIDVIAVTYGPGLIGSLLVGIETAKTLALLWNKPMISVNHMYGHIYANYIRNNSNDTMPQFPAIALVVSGGHTDIVYMKEHGDLEVIGGTRDDAAGEAFDKIGRLLGLPYPAGPVISKLALSGNPKAFKLPRPMWDSKDYDFSFSGLKTSVFNLIKKNGWQFNVKKSVNVQDVLSDKPQSREITNFVNVEEQLLADLSASVQKAIVDVLVFKTLNAVKEYNVKSLLLGGGVAANKQLTNSLKLEIEKNNLDIQTFIPPAKFCTDNAAMIATAGFYNDNLVSWENVTANPELYY